MDDWDDDLDDDGMGGARMLGTVFLVMIALGAMGLLWWLAR
jgi:hypothetical protein